MKILVTGGAGFIGSNFIEYMALKYPDYDLVCLDSLAYGADNLKEIEKFGTFKFIKGDITDSNLIDKIFKKEKFDIVVNFAAESYVDYSIKNPNIFVKTNVEGTLNLLNASLKYNVLRFHQISTDEVYGDVSLHSIKKMKETSMLKPSNPYAASKAAADMLVLSFARTYGLKVTISRSTNNYGPRQLHDNLVPVVIKNAIKNEHISLHGRGNHIRDWIYVMDHVKAIDKIIHFGKIGQIYNVSVNNKIKNKTLVKRILNYLNKSTELIKYVEDRPGNDIKYSISSKKIRMQLHFKSQHKFDESLKSTIDWYVNKYK